MWEWQEGVPSIDLTQTVRDVRGNAVDDLCSDEDLAAWLDSQQGRVPPLAPGEREVAVWRSLREAISDAFAAVLAGEPLPTDAVEHINACAGPVLPQLREGGLEYVPSGALAAVAASAIELLGTDTRERLRFCAAPSCGMYYLGHRADQQWCSPACGTRARVARHARRHRSSAPRQSPAPRS
jgi:predicted RNA-binding Zn ribbon-like protein